MKTKPRKILFIIVAVIVALFVVTLIAIPFLIMPMFLGQRYQQTQYESLDYGIESQRITIETDDSLSLAAWRTCTDDPKGTVIILSGIQNPSVTAFFGYAKMLADNGWDSLLIEMRARSESEGEEIGFGMTEWLDVKAGVDFLMNEDDVNELPIVALGSSMGGGTVLIAAGELEEIDAVISVAAFSSWPDLFVDNMVLSGFPRFLGVLEKPFINLYDGFHFGFDSLKYSPINGISRLGDRPLLMMHSMGDTQIPFTSFEKLLKAANKNNINVSTFIREGDEHFFCYDAYFEDPTQDTAFSQTILEFLAVNFP